MLYNKVITYTGAKIMKKLIALLLVSVMLLSLFACKDEDDGTGTVTPPDQNPSDDNMGDVVYGESEEDAANPLDYGLGEYITSVTYRNVVYYIYEDGAVVYDCFCPMDVIEIPETVSYTVPAKKPDEPEDDEDGTEELPEGDGSDDEVALAEETPDNEECTECEKDDAAGTTATASVLVIGRDAFYKVGASEIKLPATVTTISDGAFRNCTSLKSFAFPEDLEYVGNEAFAYTALESVNVESEIVYGNKVYYGCADLSEVTFDVGTTAIANGMFASCEKLVGINLPETLVNIGDEAFADCVNLKNITLPANLETIGAKAFSSCKSLEAIVVPANVVSIGNNAYYNCTLAASISIGSSVESIGNYAFYGCTALSEIKLPASLKNIGEGSFGALNIESIALPSGITVIPAKAFINCANLVNVSYGQNVFAIGDKAFAGTAIKSFTIPASVTSLGTYIFSGCKALESVTVLGAANGEREITVGEDTIKQPTVTLEDGIFSGCENLVTVDLRASLTDIDVFAFEGCSSLESIKFPASLTVIGGGAFRNCTSLKNMNIDKIGLESIGMGSFSGCTSLESVVLPASCDTIAGSAATNKGLFDGCTSLKSVVILGDIVRLGTELFKDCTALESVTLSDAVIYIGERTFANCTVLKNINISENIVEFGIGAFFNCPALTEVTIGKNVTKLEGYAFGFLENENVPEGLIKKPLVNPNFTLKGYLGTEFENYIQSYVDMNGETVVYEALGRVINGVGEQVFSDYEYEIVPDAVIVGQQTVINEETGEEEIVEIFKDGVIIKKYNGSEETVIVPISFRFKDLYVIGIADGAFKGNTTAKVIVLPEYLKSIGNEAFAQCSALKQLVFKNTAYKLDADAEEGAIAGALEIGEDILKDTTDVKIFASEGSYIDSIAEEKNWTVYNAVPDYEAVKPSTPV